MRSTAELEMFPPGCFRTFLMFPLMFCLCAQNEKVPKKEDVSEINGIKILRQEEKCETVK